MINLINIYAPSAEAARTKNTFFKLISNKFTQLDDLIVMGDWNLVEDNTRDREYTTRSAHTTHSHNTKIH